MKVTTKKKAAAAGNGSFVNVGGYKKVTRERRDTIVKHLDDVLKNTTNLDDILKQRPPQGDRSGGQVKVFDDDIDDIIKASREYHWTIPEIVLLFQRLQRPISYATVQRVLSGKIKKGRGQRRGAEAK